MNPVTSSTPERDPDRWLKARLDLIVAAPPLSALLNPIFASLLVIPFGGSFPAFGVIPLPVLLAIVGAHAVTAAIAIAIHILTPKLDLSPRQMLALLLAFQFVAGSTWALTAALCWIEGNDANNTFIALIVIANMWALVLTRGYLAAMFALGLLILLTSLWTLSLTSEGQAATMFVFVAPIFAAYAWFMGTSSRDRVDKLLGTRFALEDMTVALEGARADAVAKTREVEAASASKSAFVANMSHELRTPLNAILGFSEMIETAAVGQEIAQQYRSYGRDIHQSGTYLLSLINDMLDVAKIEAGKMDLYCQDIDGETLVATAAKLVAHRVEQKHQTLNIDVDRGVKAFADERALKQILVNLLSNAVKFTPERGVIDLSFTGTPDGRVRMSVADSGPGIPDEQIMQLFRPFARVDNSYGRSTGGTGLGLALARGLVTLHGGRIWLENKPAGGLRASVELPGRQVQAAA